MKHKIYFAGKILIYSALVYYFLSIVLEYTDKNFGFYCSLFAFFAVCLSVVMWFKKDIINLKKNKTNH
jgi:hypothetical protein